MSKKKHSDPFKQIEDLHKKIKALGGNTVPSRTIESGRIGTGPDRFDMAGFPIAGTAEEIFAQIHETMHIRQANTEASDWLHAQRERQIQFGIRGGGAPASREETAAQVTEIMRQRSGIRLGIRGANPTETREKIQQYQQAVSDFNAWIREAHPDSHVAILFRSGGPFVYTSSIPGDYFQLVDSDSKGKWVWKRGWGPNRSPSYLPVSITEDRVLVTQGVNSSWLVQVWLLAG
jgi:hypothetical protein